MKITKSQLKQIIKEELESVLKEQYLKPLDPDLTNYEPGEYEGGLHGKTKMPAGTLLKDPDDLTGLKQTSDMTYLGDRDMQPTVGGAGGTRGGWRGDGDAGSIADADGKMGVRWAKEGDAGGEESEGDE